MATRPCPRCNQPLLRVRRRVKDRLLSIVVTMYRYECESPMCKWKGLLRRPRASGPQDRPQLHAD
jgi:hypothetical protein